MARSSTTAEAGANAFAILHIYIHIHMPISTAYQATCVLCLISLFVAGGGRRVGGLPVETKYIHTPQVYVYLHMCIYRYICLNMSSTTEKRERLCVQIYICMRALRVYIYIQCILYMHLHIWLCMLLHITDLMRMYLVWNSIYILPMYVYV